MAAKTRTKSGSRPYIISTTSLAWFSRAFLPFCFLSWKKTTGHLSQRPAPPPQMRIALALANSPFHLPSEARIWFSVCGVV
jgi:hypothetical protein